MKLEDMDKGDEANFSFLLVFKVKKSLLFQKGFSQKGGILVRIIWSHLTLQPQKGKSQGE